MLESNNIIRAYSFVMPLQGTQVYIITTLDDVTIINTQSWIFMHSYYVQDKCCLPILLSLEKYCKKIQFPKFDKCFHGCIFGAYVNLGLIFYF
jgi:hypothetical protein